MGFEYDPNADGFISPQELLERLKEEYQKPLEFAAACKKKLKSLEQLTSQARRQFLEYVKKRSGKTEEELMRCARDYLVTDYIEREERSLQEASQSGISLAVSYPRNSENGPHRVSLTEAEIEARMKNLAANAFARSWEDEDLLFGIRKVLLNNSDDPTVSAIEVLYNRFRVRFEYRNSFRSHSKPIRLAGQALPLVHSSSVGNHKDNQKPIKNSPQVNSSARVRFQQIPWHGSKSELKKVWKVLVKLDHVTNDDTDTFVKQFLPHFQITSLQQPSKLPTYRPVYWKGKHLQLIALFWFLTHQNLIEEQSYFFLGATLTKHFVKDGRPIKRRTINRNKQNYPEDIFKALVKEYENLFLEMN